MRGWSIERAKGAKSSTEFRGQRGELMERECGRAAPVTVFQSREGGHLWKSGECGRGAYWRLLSPLALSMGFAQS
jgi:hypothetical protein